MASLQVIRMSGWHRNMAWGATGLPWVPPSPNIPTPEAAFLYNGMGLFEGTALSEGRGTTLPFALIGAPWLDPTALVAWARAAVAGGQLAGVLFREAYFTPQFDKVSEGVASRA